MRISIKNVRNKLAIILKDLNGVRSFQFAVSNGNKKSQRMSLNGPLDNHDVLKAKRFRISIEIDTPTCSLVSRIRCDCYYFGLSFSTLHVFAYASEVLL